MKIKKDHESYDAPQGVTHPEKKMARSFFDCFTVDLYARDPEIEYSFPQLFRKMVFRLFRVSGGFSTELRVDARASGRG
jgi:hypothetical protein